MPDEPGEGKALLRRALGNKDFDNGLRGDIIGDALTKGSLSPPVLHSKETSVNTCQKTDEVTWGGGIDLFESHLRRKIHRWDMIA